MINLLEKVASPQTSNVTGGKKKRGECRNRGFLIPTGPITLRCEYASKGGEEGRKRVGTRGLHELLQFSALRSAVTPESSSTERGREGPRWGSQTENLLAGQHGGSASECKALGRVVENARLGRGKMSQDNVESPKKNAYGGKSTYRGVGLRHGLHKSPHGSREGRRGGRGGTKTRGVASGIRKSFREEKKENRSTALPGC